MICGSEWVSDGIASEMCPCTIGDNVRVYYVRQGGITRGEFRRKDDAELFHAALVKAKTPDLPPNVD